MYYVILFFLYFLWSIVGFFLWIPLLFRMTMIFFSLVVAATFSEEISLYNAQIGLEKAVGLYAFGFRKIKESLFEKESARTPNRNEDRRSGINKFIIVLFEFIYALLFWGITLQIIFNFLSFGRLFQYLRWPA
jgi:hypothetical protein